MDSSHVRLLLAGLFVTFLVIVVLKDLVRRKPRSRATPKDHGFRSTKAPPRADSLPHRSWKAGPRR
jgi:hypothetical protein